MAHSAGTPYLIAAAAALFLSGCGGEIPPHLRPIPPETKALLAEKGMAEDSAMFIRIFKEESELEVWKAKDDGHFHYLKTYPICNWSGKLGPKLKQGDKQAPEGFYTVSPRQMNPNSNFHLAFNLGYPNRFDKSHGRTGNYLMVHGDCRSAGCYAMTDALMEELYALARESFRGGQKKFHVHAYPFRMTQANMRRHSRNRSYRFWRDLQVGYEHFEYTRQAPKVDVCERRYLVNVAFLDGAPDSPDGACPIYEALPLEAAPRSPDIQQAQKKAPATASAKRRADTAASQATIGRGRVFGFAPAKPSYSAFGFAKNKTLGN